MSFFAHLNFHDNSHHLCLFFLIKTGHKIPLDILLVGKYTISLLPSRLKLTLLSCLILPMWQLKLKGGTKLDPGFVCLAFLHLPELINTGKPFAVPLVEQESVVGFMLVEGEFLVALERLPSLLVQHVDLLGLVTLHGRGGLECLFVEKPLLELEVFLLVGF